MQKHVYHYFAKIFDSLRKIFRLRFVWMVFIQVTRLMQNLKVIS